MQAEIDIRVNVVPFCVFYIQELFIIVVLNFVSHIKYNTERNSPVQLSDVCMQNAIPVSDSDQYVQIN